MGNSPKDDVGRKKKGSSYFHRCNQYTYPKLCDFGLNFKNMNH